MAIQQETFKTYPIPDNFVDDSRVIKGMFRRNNFIEGIILALIMLPIAMLVPVSTSSLRITAIILCCGPFFLLGIVGINGDTFFTFVRNFFAWRGNRTMMIYNSTPRALIKSPLEALMETETAKDKLIDTYERFRDKQKMKNAGVSLIEGVNFEFEDDPMLKRLYIDYQKEQNEKKAKGDTKKKKKKAASSTNKEDKPLLVDTENIQNVVDIAEEIEDRRARENRETVTEDDESAEDLIQEDNESLSTEEEANSYSEEYEEEDDLATDSSEEENKPEEKGLESFEEIKFEEIDFSQM